LLEFVQVGFNICVYHSEKMSIMETMEQ